VLQETVLLEYDPSLSKQFPRNHLLCDESWYYRNRFLNPIALKISKPATTTTTMMTTATTMLCGVHS
jgi:hypothetical protein